MGNILVSPVTSIFAERNENEIFRSAYTCMNGYRLNNEDSHCIVKKNELYFSGVFDGHCGDRCSKYISENLPTKILEQKIINADTIKKACLEVDNQFLEIAKKNNYADGSTATFSIISKNNNKYNVIIGNIGDSFTILLKKEDIFSQKIVNFVTSEHTPNQKEERERIERNGGFVKDGRVDGNLAVSRAFGDIPYKGKVIAEPDVYEFECEEGDIVIHICDGITEGNFQMDEVCYYIRNNLKKYQDIAVTSAYTCLEALNRKSNDNLSCLIIVLGNTINQKNCYPLKEFIPGPVYLQNNQKFNDAYKNMICSFGLDSETILNQRLKIIEEPNLMSELEKKIYCHTIYSDAGILDIISKDEEQENIKKILYEIKK
jgi:serine/threonine protein phosphatase PrpC